MSQPPLSLHGTSAALSTFEMPSAVGESVRAIRPRAGMVYMRRYDDGRLHARFMEIAKALRASGHSADSVSENELSRLTGRLMAFYDTALGRDSPLEKRTLTRVPARFFQDYSRDGALKTIIDECLRFKSVAGWDKFDFRDPERHEKNMEMLVSVERALRAAKQLTVFSVYLAPSLPADEVEYLRSILLSHGGVVVSLPEVATHVIYPDPPGTTEGVMDSQVMLRMLSAEAMPGGTRALVHWFYHPDSYDDWIYAKDVAGVVEPDPPERVGPWHVQARWVRDLQSFNEWMNERDYEMPASFVDYVGSQPPHVAEARLAAEGGVGKSRNFGVRLRLRMPEDSLDAPAAKRMRENSDKVTLVGLPSISRIGVSDGSGTDRNAGASGGKSIADGGKEMDEMTPRRSKRAAGLEPDAQKSKGQNDSKRRRPAHSNWFDMKRVNAIEHRALPEFFDSRSPSKTSKNYVEMRNFLVSTWSRTPDRYLTATAARRNLRGDACAILRIHSFLEHWGLINYNVDPETRPQSVFVPPPPPLPVEAGRTDPATGERRTVLFLDDGCPADVHENRIRRIRIDGVPVASEENDGNGIIDTTGAAADSGEPKLVSPGSAMLHGPRGDAAFETPTGTAHYDGRLRGSSGLPNSGMSSRPVRSTRYSSRRRSAYKYTEDDSDDDDDSSDGSEEEEEMDEATTPKDDGSEVDIDTASGMEDDKDGGDVEYHCDICGQDCTKVRYHCTTQADMDLCEDCFKGGKYPQPLQAKDFILMTAAPPGPDTSGAHPSDPLVWSEAETLLLLEALEMYGERWDMVAEHVDSKNMIQCISQFLRLPIEESFLQNIRENWWTKPGAMSADDKGAGPKATAGAARRSDTPSGSDNWTPASILRNNGVKESALLDAVSGLPSLTGKPLVFADRVNTVTSQVALLASLTPANMVDKVLAKVSADAGSVSGTAPATPAGSGLGKDELVTESLYVKKLSDVPLVTDIAAEDRGLLAAKLAIEAIREGRNIAGQGVEEIAAALKANDRDRLASSPGNDSGISVLDGSSAQCSGKKKSKRGPSLDASSTQSTAVAALVCSALRTKELLAAEEEELRRLYSLIFEIKLSMIEMKVDHLKAIEKHRALARVYSERQQREEFGMDCILAERLIDGQHPLDSRNLVAYPTAMSNVRSQLNARDVLAGPVCVSGSQGEYVAAKSVVVMDGSAVPSMASQFECHQAPPKSASVVSHAMVGTGPVPVNHPHPPGATSRSMQNSTQSVPPGSERLDAVPSSLAISPVGNQAPQELSNTAPPHMVPTKKKDLPMEDVSVENAASGHSAAPFVAASPNIDTSSAAARCDASVAPLDAGTPVGGSGPKAVAAAGSSEDKETGPLAQVEVGSGPDPVHQANVSDATPKEPSHDAAAKPNVIRALQKRRSSDDDSAREPSSGKGIVAEKAHCPGESNEIEESERLVGSASASKALEVNHVGLDGGEKALDTVSAIPIASFPAKAENSMATHSSLVRTEPKKETLVGVVVDSRDELVEDKAPAAHPGINPSRPGGNMSGDKLGVCAENGAVRDTAVHEKLDAEDDLVGPVDSIASGEVTGDVDGAQVQKDREACDALLSVSRSALAQECQPRSAGGGGNSGT